VWVAVIFGVGVGVGSCKAAVLKVLPTLRTKFTKWSDSQRRRHLDKFFHQQGVLVVFTFEYFILCRYFVR